MIARQTGAAALLAILLGGCAADRVSGVRPASTPPTTASVAAERDGRCTFNVEAIADLREQDDLGAMGPKRVHGEHFLPWLKAGIASMPGHVREPAPVKLRIDIHRAYIHGLSTMKSVNIVAVVRMDGEAGRSRQRTYRGVDSSINWWNSEAEFQTAFDAALLDLRRQIGADLQDMCRA